MFQKIHLVKTRTNYSVSSLAVASKTYQTAVNKSQLAAKQVKFRICSGQQVPIRESGTN
jgi:hypothetical protein